MDKKLTTLVVFAALMMVVAFSGITVWAQEVASPDTVNQGQSGTTLIDASVTATPTNTLTYKWTLDKTASWTSKEICKDIDPIPPVDYTITWTKDAGTTVKEIKGTVKVTNGGAVATDGLAITVKVVNPSGSATYITQTVDVSGNPVLDPNEVGTYDYVINVAGQLSEGSQYKVTADITILNHSGHITTPPTPFGPSPSSAGFTWPTQTVVHDSATISDTSGLTTPLPVSASGSKTYTYNGLQCGENKNTATLTFTDGGSPITKDVIVTLNCKDCKAGCSLTIGYWKTHSAAAPGKQEDAVNQYLPIWLGTPNGAKSVKVTTSAQAAGLLGYSGDASNGINKLYGQLLAAKLNIANGASPSTISGTISSADAFLATHNAGDWSTLSKTEQQQVLKWVNILDQYNNGILPGGPTHCLDTTAG